MRGIKTFLKQNLPAMVDYILVVSTPIYDAYNPHSGHPAFSHHRLKVVNSLHQRGSTIPTLSREAIPLLPHVLDIPRHLACISASLIRSARLVGPKVDSVEKDHLSDLCSRCFEVEETALQRVRQFTTVESHPVALRWDVPRPYFLDKSPHSPPSPISPPKPFRPSTAPSSSEERLAHSLQPLPNSFPPPNPSSGVVSVPRRGSVPEISSRKPLAFLEDRVSRGLGRPRFLRPKSISTDSISTLMSTSVEPHTPSPSAHVPRNPDASSGAAFDESGKKTKSIFTGLLI